MKKKTEKIEETAAEAERKLRDAAIETATNVAMGIVDSVRGLRANTPVIDSPSLKQIEQEAIKMGTINFSEEKFKAIFGDDFIDRYPIKRRLAADAEAARNAVLYGNFNIPSLGKAVYTVKATDEEPEEWIWVEGYKGTDKDMKCRDFQFELNKEFYHEGDVNLCCSGFHFCQKLKNVFIYYNIRQGNRFFKVRALVNKKKYKEGNSKDTSKAIIFTEELSREEIFAAFVERTPEAKDLPAKYFDTLFNGSAISAVYEWQIDTLVLDGYSPELAEYFVKNLHVFNVAHIFASQPGLSMDAKVIGITNIACNRRPF